jgi:thioesterase domain-containing protein/acyl carrier protein
MSVAQFNEQTLTDWMIERVARQLEVPTTGVDPQAKITSLGIDSMSLIGLVGELAELIGQDLPADVIWEHDSVSRLAKFLATRNVDAPDDDASSGNVTTDTTENLYFSRSHRWMPCHAIHPDGSRDPFFLAPEVDGGVFGYQRLAQHLGPDQPTYILSLPNVPVLSIEHLAAAMIDDLRTVQRVGPYRLGGYCFGGVLAYEIARQLDAMRQKVSLLVMLDGLPPRNATARAIKDPRNWMRVLRSGFCHAPMFLASELRRSPRQLFARQTNRVSRWTRRIAHGLKLIESSLSDQQVRKWSTNSCPEVVRGNLYALRDYTPQPYAGLVTFVQSDEFAVFHPTTPWYWHQIAAGGVHVTSVPGNHIMMLNEPTVACVARKLSECLCTI